MENIIKPDSSSPSTTEIRGRKIPSYTFVVPSAQEIRENRNTIINILDTLKTLSQKRSRNDLQVERNSSSCGQCPCTKLSLIDADINYLKELMNSSGFFISRADCAEAYQVHDALKFVSLISRALIKVECVNNKRQKMDTVVAAEFSGRNVSEASSSAKREAIFKAVRWMENKTSSQYSFDSARSEFRVLIGDDDDSAKVPVPDTNRNV